MKLNKFFHFYMTFIIFFFNIICIISLLHTLLAYEFSYSGSTIFMIILVIVFSCVCIYEIIILFMLISARKGKVVEAKLIRVKRKMWLLETLIIEVDGKQYQTSPILYLRSYEYVFSKSLDKINIVESNGRYFVAYK